MKQKLTLGVLVLCVWGCGGSDPEDQFREKVDNYVEFLIEQGGARDGLSQPFLDSVVVLKFCPQPDGNAVVLIDVPIEGYENNTTGHHRKKRVEIWTQKILGIVIARGKAHRAHFGNPLPPKE